MHACHAATSHRHRGRAIVIVIILTASEGTPHYAPPETEPNWLLSLPTDLVISEQEERSERGTEGGEQRSDGERETSSSHSSKFVPPGCLPVRRRRRQRRRSRTEEATPLTARPARSAVRRPSRYQYGQSATWYVNKHDQ